MSSLPLVLKGHEGARGGRGEATCSLRGGVEGSHQAEKGNIQEEDRGFI